MDDGIGVRYHVMVESKTILDCQDISIVKAFNVSRGFQERPDILKIPKSQFSRFPWKIVAAPTQRRRGLMMKRPKSVAVSHTGDVYTKRPLKLETLTYYCPLERLWDVGFASILINEKLKLVVSINEHRAIQCGRTSMFCLVTMDSMGYLYDLESCTERTIRYAWSNYNPPLGDRHRCQTSKCVKDGKRKLDDPAFRNLPDLYSSIKVYDPSNDSYQISTHEGEYLRKIRTYHAHLPSISDLHEIFAVRVTCSFSHVILYKSVPKYQTKMEYVFLAYTSMCIEPMASPLSRCSRLMVVQIVSIELADPTPAILLRISCMLLYLVARDALKAQIS
ncbi:hypothetical protein V1478_008291 [Vespula squamosa]|uniref:Uncharacterized protein n=1 Tax=Vespula squamosa TaxID=30214 RepID=A0ABD2AYE4_VESSQ